MLAFYSYISGCSLLLLNALVFAGVYYRRDKRHGQLHSQDGSQTTSKKRTENGGPMANICVTGGKFWVKVTKCIILVSIKVF